MNRNIPVIKIAFYLLAGLFVIILINRILLIFTYNLDIVGIEPLFVFKIQSLMAGIPVYLPPEKPPFLLNQYNPLYFSVCKWIGLALGIDAKDIRPIYILGRSMNVFFNVGTVIASYMICRKAKAPILNSLIAAALVLFVFTPHNYAVRPDSMKTFFVILSFYFLIDYGRNAKSIPFFFATATYLLALWTKQDAIIFAPILFLAPFILHQKRQFGLPIIFATCVLLTFGIAYLTVGKPYFTSSIHKFTLGMELDIFVGLFKYRWKEITLFLVIIGILMGYLLKYKPDKSIRLLCLAGTFAFLFGLFAFGKFGASPVYLLDGQILLLITLMIAIAHPMLHPRAIAIRIGIILLLVAILLPNRQQSVLYATYFKTDEKKHRSVYELKTRSANELENHMDLGPGENVLTFDKFLINRFFDRCYFASYDAEFPQLYAPISQYINDPITPMIQYERLEPLVKSGALKYYIMERNHPLESFLDLKLTGHQMLILNDEYILYRLE